MQKQQAMLALSGITYNLPGATGPGADVTGDVNTPAVTRTPKLSEIYPFTVEEEALAEVSAWREKERQRQQRQKQRQERLWQQAEVLGVLFYCDRLIHAILCDPG